MPPSGNGRGPQRARGAATYAGAAHVGQPVAQLAPEAARLRGAARPASDDSWREHVEAAVGRHRSAVSVPLDPVPFEGSARSCLAPRPAGRARVLDRPSPGGLYSTAERQALDAVEPQSSPAGRQIEGVGASLMEQKRITPRSPRAALEPEQVAVPTRRSGRARNPIVMVGNAIFTLLVLLLLAGGAAFAVVKSRLEAEGPLEADKIVNIPPHLGLIERADLLRREGVMEEGNAVFIGSVFALKPRGELKFGEYLFAKHASLRDVLETMIEGKVVQHPITVAEGLTSEQIVQILNDSDILSGTINTIPREGSLLPGTYNESRGASREQVIKRMQAAEQRLLQDVWEHRSPDLPVRTPEQLVILASIVEKETGKPDERTRVAAVFVNRLKQKMKLQSDPTIIYGLVFGKGKLDHPITKAEKEQPTPYNTYFIDGLPPGPITNPGRASLEAAANPARTKELFFVADGTGGHSFSESYDQHQRNVGKLRALEQEAKDDDALAPARAAAGKPGAPAPKRPPPPKPQTPTRPVPPTTPE
jgi:UPF0755 protein